LIYSDLLTGLHNRFSLFGIIEEGLGESLDRIDAIIFIDVDNFKYINDTYGHDIGDLVIKETGKKLKGFQTEKIEIGRFGGDEFLIYGPGFETRREILTLLEELTNTFRSPIEVEDRKFYLTISMGIALSPDHGVSRNELMKKAAVTLYSSK